MAHRTATVIETSMQISLVTLEFSVKTKMGFPGLYRSDFVSNMSKAFALFRHPFHRLVSTLANAVIVRTQCIISEIMSRFLSLAVVARNNKIRTKCPKFPLNFGSTHTDYLYCYNLNTDSCATSWVRLDF